MKEITKYPKWYLPLSDFTPEELKIANEYRKRFLCDERNYYFYHEMYHKHALLNFHTDGSGYWVDSLDGLKESFDITDKQQITKSEFFQLINEDKFVLPEKWCVKIEKHSMDDLVKWNRARGGTHNCPNLDQWVTSDKFIDGYGYFGRDDLDGWSNICKQYTKITFEQFEKYVLNKSKTNTMDKNKQIKIDRQLLNHYYESATMSQRQYISDNFKIDGTTTVGAIQGLHDIACSNWKPKIKENHPECFEAEKFDLSDFKDYGYKGKRMIERIQVNTDDLFHQGFWLNDDDFTWELKKSKGIKGGMLLIPKRK